MRKQNWLVRFVGRNAHWDVLRKFGSTTIAKATIVVPVIGYVLLFNEQLSEYFALVVDPKAAGQAVHLSRLYFIYFGFCALAVGSIIFAIWCPDMVKEHGNAFTFVERESRIMNQTRMGGMEAELRAKYGPSWDVNAAERLITQEAIMTRYFEMLEEHRPFARWCVGFFYALGAVLLAVPTVQTFWRVLQHVVHD